MGRQTKARSYDDQIKISGLSTSEATIVIVETENGNFSASGTAKRGNGDKDYEPVGTSLALARALENLARKIRREIKEYL